MVVPSLRARYLVVAEAAGAALAILGGAVPRGASPFAAHVWTGVGVAIALVAIATWVLRRRRLVLLASLTAAMASLAVLLLVTSDPARAATLIVPMMLGGQLAAFLLPARQWKGLAWLATALAAVGAVLSPAGFDPTQVLASVALVGLGLTLIGGVYSQVHDQATRDPLTGAYSRAVLDRIIEQTIARASSGEAQCLAVVDLDGLKALNDSAGHAAGDRALVEVVRALRDSLSGDDLVARLGGDEFVVLFTDLDERAARRRLDRALQRSVHAWSFGLTVVRGDDCPASVLERADAQLYEHKSRPLEEPALEEPALD